VDTPYIRIEDTGEVIPLRSEGHYGRTWSWGGCPARGPERFPGCTREIVRRGPYFYVADLGLSRNGTRVNGRPIARRVLDDGDVLTFGTAPLPD